VDAAEHSRGGTWGGLNFLGWFHNLEGCFSRAVLTAKREHEIGVPGLIFLQHGRHEIHLE